MLNSDVDIHVAVTLLPAAEMTVKLDQDSKTVMVYRGGQWGYICDDDLWTDAEAETICKGLNYTNGFSSHRSSFSPTYPFLLHNVSCGTEAGSLAHCHFNDVDSDVCQFLDPAAVYCYNEGDCE